MHKSLVVLISAALFIQACASARKVERPKATSQNAPITESKPQSAGPLEIYGPPVMQDKTESYGPEPIEVRPVVLVLGPGLARGFAYVGVLKALIDSKIPIGAIYATEMGSLVGTLFAVSANVNQFEWGLQKFRPEIFVEQRGFLARIKNELSEGQKFEKQLKSTFGNRDLKDTKIPVRIGIQTKDTGMLMILDKGSIVQAIRSAIAAPGLFTPGSWPNKENGVAAISAAPVRPFLIAEAKSLGLGPVIVVDVLSDSEAAVAFDELKQADLVVKPDVTGIGNTDFDKKTISAYRGKTAVYQNLSEIRRLVGMPENDSDKKER